MDNQEIILALLAAISAVILAIMVLIARQKREDARYHVSLAASRLFDLLSGRVGEAAKPATLRIGLEALGFKNVEVRWGTHDDPIISGPDATQAYLFWYDLGQLRQQIAAAPTGFIRGMEAIEWVMLKYMTDDRLRAVGKSRPW